MFQATPLDTATTFTERALGSETALSVFRPIQYLGSKLRSIDPLLSHTKHLFSQGDLVVDCFSGSSVVSQAYANAGAQVLAVDSQKFCKDIASALLGVSRLDIEKCSAIALSLVQQFLTLEIRGELGKLQQAEKNLLEKGPSQELVDFYATLPQVWRSSNSLDWFFSVNAHYNTSAHSFPSLITARYAGTYFGLRQALFFDYVRNQIHELKESEEISKWAVNALLTSLYSSMSSSVCSAGKHFAQPLAVKSTGNPRFRIIRLYTDRSIDCISAFCDAAVAIDKFSQSGHQKNDAWEMPISSVHTKLIEMKPRLLYADPPYTAQQYSRFYHVLEVVSKNETPEFQMVKGKITSGLYSTDRYKSPYSSKAGAPKAFDELVATSKIGGSSLALSYSSSSETSIGNSRMISLPDLKKICQYYYGKNVKVIELSHAYRPFNSDSNNNVSRNDPEILIVCEA